MNKMKEFNLEHSDYCRLVKSGDKKKLLLNPIYFKSLSSDQLEKEFNTVEQALSYLMSAVKKEQINNQYYSFL